MVDGLALMTAAQTLVELARDLTLVDLVPIVDCALAAGTSPDEILAAAMPRARGARTLRRAVGLADPRSESWWESVLRLVHVVAGLGPVECQVDVAGRTTRGGSPAGGSRRAGPASRRTGAPGWRVVCGATAWLPSADPSLSGATLWSTRRLDHEIAPLDRGQTQALAGSAGRWRRDWTIRNRLAT